MLVLNLIKDLLFLVVLKAKMPLQDLMVLLDVPKHFTIRVVASQSGAQFLRLEMVFLQILL